MTAAAHARAQLVVNTPDGGMKTVPLEADKYELGRDESNTLPFPGVQGLSRRHLMIERTAGGWSIRDLGSTNGTLVNGKRITEPRPLAARDRISAGALTILYELSASATPASRTMLFVEKSAANERPTLEATLDGVLASDPELRGSPHMRALIQAGRELCARGALDELFKVIMDLSVEAVGASRGVLITAESGEFQVRARKGDGFQISSHVRDLVIQQRRSLIVNDALSDAALSAHQSIVQAQIRGILAVPLQTDKSVIGLIYLDSPVLIKQFTQDDLNVLTVLANIAAIRIEQARLAEIEKAEMLRARELEHAALIQRSMLPPEGPAFPNRREFDLRAAMVPAKEVGGDFYDYFLLDEDHLAFAVGDVSGKGAPAALFMAVTRTLLRATAENQKGPAECFAYVNNTLSEGDSGMYVTLFYGVLNTRTGELAFVNAGHVPPLVFASSGEEPRLLKDRSGPAVGLLPGSAYKVHNTRLESGEGIMIFTDGVTEALNRDEEFFGDARTARFLQEHSGQDAARLTASAHETVKDFAKGMPQADDITVLVLRRPPQ